MSKIFNWRVHIIFTYFFLYFAFPIPSFQFIFSYYRLGWSTSLSPLDLSSFQYYLCLLFLCHPYQLSKPIQLISLYIFVSDSTLTCSLTSMFLILCLLLMPITQRLLPIIVLVLSRFIFRLSAYELSNISISITFLSPALYFFTLVFTYFLISSIIGQGWAQNYPLFLS